jgi:Antibiotic biosynthesis monooxygenase
MPVHISLTSPPPNARVILIQCFNFISKLESKLRGERKIMIKVVEMDEKVTFTEQREQKKRWPNVKPEGVEHFLRAWAADAAYFKQQPGFISAQLHRGIGGSSVFVNYAVWESTELYKRAFNNSDFVQNIGVSC